MHGGVVLIDCLTTNLQGLTLHPIVPQTTFIMNGSELSDMTSDKHIVVIGCVQHDGSTCALSAYPNISFLVLV